MSRAHVPHGHGFNMGSTKLQQVEYSLMQQSSNLQKDSLIQLAYSMAYLWHTAFISLFYSFIFFHCLLYLSVTAESESLKAVRLGEMLPACTASRSLPCWKGKKSRHPWNPPANLHNRIHCPEPICCSIRRPQTPQVVLREDITRAATHPGIRSFGVQMPRRVPILVGSACGDSGIMGRWQHDGQSGFVAGW